MATRLLYIFEAARILGIPQIVIHRHVEKLLGGRPMIEKSWFAYDTPLLDIDEIKAAPLYEKLCDPAWVDSEVQAILEERKQAAEACFQRIPSKRTVVLAEKREARLAKKRGKAVEEREQRRVAKERAWAAGAAERAKVEAAEVERAAVTKYSAGLLAKIDFTARHYLLREFTRSAVVAAAELLQVTGKPINEESLRALLVK